MILCVRIRFFFSVEKFVLYSLSPGSVQQKSNQGRCTRARAVIRQKGVFELVFAHHVLRELHVKFILRTEDLNVLRNVWCKILHRPRPVAKCYISETLLFSIRRESY